MGWMGGENKAGRSNSQGLCLMELRHHWKGNSGPQIKNTQPRQGGSQIRSQRTGREGTARPPCFTLGISGSTDPTGNTRKVAPGPHQGSWIRAQGTATLASTLLLLLRSCVTWLRVLPSLGLGLHICTIRESALRISAGPVLQKSSCSMTNPC